MIIFESLRSRTAAKKPDRPIVKIIFDDDTRENKWKMNDDETQIAR